MALVMCRLGNQFPDNSQVTIFTPRLGLCYLILDLVHKVHTSNRLDACKDVIMTGQPIDLAVEIANRMRKHKVPIYGETVLSSDDVNIIWDCLIERFDVILQTNDIFDIMPDSSLWIMANIYYERGKIQQIDKVLTAKLNESSDNAMKIIKIFTPTIYSSAAGYNPYKGNFKKENYEELNRYINLEDIYTATVNTYGAPTLIPMTDPEHGELKDENLIAHFQHIHKEHYNEMSN
jgi:hypothetical protein